MTKLLWGADVTVEIWLDRGVEENKSDGNQRSRFLDAAHALVSFAAGRSVSHLFTGVPGDRVPALQGSARSAAYARRSVHVAATCFFSGVARDTRWQKVWACRKQESRALWLESQQPACLLTIGLRQHCGPCCHLWHAASPINAHMSTCQSDGADLSPANLSCPGQRDRC